MLETERQKRVSSSDGEVRLRYLIMQVGLIVVFITGASISLLIG